MAVPNYQVLATTPGESVSLAAKALREIGYLVGWSTRRYSKGREFEGHISGFIWDHDFILFGISVLLQPATLINVTTHGATVAMKVDGMQWLRPCRKHETYGACGGCRRVGRIQVEKCIARFVAKKGLVPLHVLVAKARKCIANGALKRGLTPDLARDVAGYVIGREARRAPR